MTTGNGETWPASSLWEYAVDLYGRLGVREACLALQDRAGVDVSLALFACWLGATGRRTEPAALAAAREAAEAWQAGVVAPLRVVRRLLKQRLPELDEALRAPIADARARLAEVELAAERAELYHLERAAGPVAQAPDPEITIDTLHELVIVDATLLPEISVLLRAAFPDVTLGILEAAAADRARRRAIRPSSED